MNRLVLLGLVQTTQRLNTTINRLIPATTTRLFKSITQKETTNNSTNDEDTFGVGSKYARLDSVKSSRGGPMIKSSLSSESEADKFGTLTDKLDSVEFQTSISYKKPFNESRFLTKAAEKEEDEEGEDEIEKKYDKVLRHIRLSNDPRERPNSENFYAHKMKELAKQKKLDDALAVFNDEMIEKDRYKPTLYLYRIIMSVLAHAGRTDQVFSIFRRLMNSRDQEWKLAKNRKQFQQIVTILFTACARSSDRSFAVKKCNSIRMYLKRNAIEMNAYNYASAISAYGRAGAIYEAFNLVDEIIADVSISSAVRKRLLTPDIFHNLMCACISQPEYGFRYALMVWQMCLTFKIRPDLAMYELLLKAAKDCSICAKKELVHLPKPDQDAKLLGRQHEQKEADNSKLALNTEQTEFKTENSKEELDVSSESLSSSSVVRLEASDVHVVNEMRAMGEELEREMRELEWWQDVKTSVDRAKLMRSVARIRPELRELVLARSFDSLLTRCLVDEQQRRDLFSFVTDEDDSPAGRLYVCTGGVDGLLKAMRAHAVKPNLKIFQLLVRIVPNNLDAENELLERMKEFNIKPDIDFTNGLIRRRALRNEIDKVDEAFKIIQKGKLSPNIRTFGCLAYLIRNQKELDEFLNNLKSFNFELNGFIFSTLFSQASFRRDYYFAKRLLEYVLESGGAIKNIQPEYLANIDETLADYKKTIIEYERSLSKNEKRSDEQETSKEERNYESTRRFYNRFSEFYDKWKVRASNVKKPADQNFVNNTTSNRIF